jgi:hypothetical protein
VTGNGVRIPTWEKIFLFSKRFRHSLGPTEPPVNGYRNFFSRSKRPELDIEHPPPSTGKLKTSGDYDLVPMVYQNSLNGNKFTVDLIVICNHLLDKKLREKMYGGM